MILAVLLTGKVDTFHTLFFLFLKNRIKDDVAQTYTSRMNTAAQYVWSMCAKWLQTARVILNPHNIL